MARKHQKLQCYYNSTSSRLIGKHTKITNAKPLIKLNYSNDVREILEQFSDWYVASKVEINGLLYKPNLCVLTDFKQDDPVFSKIILILWKGQDVHFVCRKYTTNTAFHVLGFKMFKTKIISVSSFDDFLDRYPLYLYRYKGNEVVIPKYLLFEH